MHTYNIISKNQLLLNRKLYIYIFFLNALFYAMPIPNAWFASKLMKVLLVWGLFIIMCDFCTKKSGLKNSNSKCLLVFIFLQCVSFSANLDGNIYRSIQDIIYNSIFFFILYGQDICKTKEEQMQILYKFNNILIYFMLMATSISMFMFFAKISFIYQYNGMSFPQGIYARRLTGCIGANTGTILGIISMIASYSNYHLRKKKILTYTINAILQIMFISLASSRGAFVTWSVIWSSFCFLYLYIRIKQKLFYIVPSVALVCIFVFLGIFGFYKATTKINSALEYLVNKPIIYSSIHESDSNILQSFQTDVVVLEQASHRSEREVDITTGRKEIWKPSLKLVEGKPILGYGNARIVDYKGRIFTDSIEFTESDILNLQNADGYLHNNYIQILVSVGLSGFFYIGLFIIISFISVYKSIKSSKKTELIFLNCIVFSVLTGLMANSIFESHLLFHQGDSIGVIFWFYLGVIFIINNLHINNKNLD